MIYDAKRMVYGKIQRQLPPNKILFFRARLSPPYCPRRSEANMNFLNLATTHRAFNSVIIAGNFDIFMTMQNEPDNQSQIL